MIVKESFEMSLRKDATCPAGTPILEMLDKADGKTALPVKLVFGSQKKAGKYAIYLAEEKDTPKGLVGKVTSMPINDKGEALDDADLDAVIAEVDYRIEVFSREGNVMHAKLLLLKDEASANQKSSSETDEELEKLMQEKIDAGIVTREEMDARVRFMKDNYVDRFLMLRIIRKYRKYNKPAHTPSCLYVDPYLEQSHKRREEGIISEGLRASAGRTALICEGEKSVGKNVYLETIAWLLGMPMYLITFSRQMSPSSIYGEKTTDNSASEALKGFDPDILMKADRVEEMIRFSMNLLFKRGIGADEAMASAMQDLSDKDKEILRQAALFKKLQAQSSSVNIVIDQSELYDWLCDGGLLVFNEMNMAEANFFASFTNQLLDGTGFLFIPGRGEVKIHPDCVLFGTQNAEYQGVEMQNEATMSRFGCLYFKQPESIKKQLMNAVASSLKKDGFAGTKLEAKFFNECENFYKQCRGAVRKGVVSNACMNIRGFVRALTAVAEGDGYCRLNRQIRIHVIDTCPFDEREALYAILDQIVTL